MKRVFKGVTSKKVMPHDQFIDRIRKSLYFGEDALADDMDMISRPLAEYSAEIFSESHKGHSLNRLNCVAAGNVTATPCSIIMALIYLDRLNIIEPGYCRRITPQELFIVSMMISTKFYTGYDEQICLSDWAIEGNMTEERLKELEVEFLCAIDWNVYISNEQFFAKLCNIEKTLAERQGLRRGWLTYTELTQLLPSFTLAKFLLNNITIMMVSYAASVMTIAGAFFLASQIPGTLLHRKNNITENANTSCENILTVSTPATVKNVRRNATNALVNDSEITIGAGEEDNGSQINLNCAAFNVEMELSKLEQQYREEAKRDNLRRKNNEITSDSRLNLPEAALLKTYGKTSVGTQSYSLKKWMVFKEICSRQTKDQSDVMNCVLNNYNNCTNFLFWNLLSSVSSQHSFMRQPLLWLKFM